MQLTQHEIEIASIRYLSWKTHCNICSSKDFRIMDEFVLLPKDIKSYGLNINYNGIACIGIACKNCGHISLFAKDELVNEINK